VMLKKLALALVLIPVTAVAQSSDVAETKHIPIKSVERNGYLGLRPFAKTSYERLNKDLRFSLSQTVKITGSMGGGTFANGSGVCIAPSLFATAAHVVRGTSRVWVVIGKKQYPARVLAKDTELDLCVLRTETYPKTHTGVEITQQPQQIGDVVLCAGFDDAGFRHWNAQIFHFNYSPSFEAGSSHQGDRLDHRHTPEQPLALLDLPDQADQLLFFSRAASIFG